MNIKILKLKNGETLISEVEQFDFESITILKLKNPITFGMGPEGIGLIEWLEPAEENEVNIPQDEFLYILTPKEDILNIYNSKYGNGIILARGGLI